MHADFGSGLYDGSRIGIPYVVVHGEVDAEVARRVRLRRRERQGPVPDSRRTCRSRASPHAERRRPARADRRPRHLQALRALRAAAHERQAGPAGSGAIWNLRSNTLRPAGWTSADAAGLPILPGLARWDGDASTGAIDHALRFTAERTRQRVHLSRAPLREQLDRSVAAADGPARAAEGERRHRAAPAAGAHRRAGAEDATG